MLINYCVNSSTVSTHQKKIQKDMIERIYWAVSFQANVKRDFREILEGHKKF